MNWYKELKFKNNIGADMISANTDEQGIIRCKIDDTDSYVFHNKYTKGAHLRKLAEVKYHQIQFETPYYRRILDDYLQSIDLANQIILDFGCGDGRFTQFLLEKGAQKIVCVDFDYATLVSLKEYANENNVADKLLIIHSDFDNLPFEGQQFDLVLSIGVLYYLNENYESAIGKFHSLLKSAGLLITSDPEIEGFFLRSLIFDSLDEALDVFNQRRFKETKEKTEYKFRVFDKAEWISIFQQAGFEVIDHRGISLFHNLLRVLLLRGNIAESEIERNEKNIMRVFDYLHENGTLNKHLVWKLKKN